MSDVHSKEYLSDDIDNNSENFSEDEDQKDYCKGNIVLYKNNSLLIL